MNIYIPIEVKVRELEGRGLLALVAAERGHTVILGGKEDTLRLPKEGKLPPGIFHDKSLTPGTSKIDYLTQMAENGHLITCQDEESGLMDESYDNFAALRFSVATVSKAGRIFAWGDHDSESLKKLYPAYSDRISCTGSPRVDFWRKEFGRYYQANGFDREGSGKRPLILVASNFSSLLNENPFWNRVARNREAGYFERDPKREFHVYENEAYQLRLIREFVFMVRDLAKAFHDVDILLRPHPVESVDAWKKLIGESPNVIVHRQGTISGWIRSASMVIHNGCSSALEAAACEIPRIAYRPYPSEMERDVPNLLSHAAFSLEELFDNVSDILSDRAPAGSAVVERKTEKILGIRFANLNGKFAADRMVDEWEKIGESIQSEQVSPWELLRRKPKEGVPFRKRVKKRLAQVKNSMISPPESPKVNEKLLKSAHKFPVFEEREVESLLNHLRSTLDRFQQVEFIRFGERSFILYNKK